MNESGIAVEVIAFQFDIERLTHHFNQYVLPLPMQMPSPGFGGWSVLSSNGNYQDGWHKGHQIYSQDCPIKREQLRQHLDFAGKKYDRPTEICHSYLMEVMNTISLKGYTVSRARLISLPPGQQSVWHRDAPEEISFHRLHVPIITNANCFFVTEKGKIHLPANGSAYIIEVNHLHKVCNNGFSSRVHLVMDIKDELNHSDPIDKSMIGRNLR